MLRRWLPGAVIALVLVAVAYVLWPSPPRRIAFLGMDSQMQRLPIQAFRDQLAKRGYVEGKNVVIDYKSAEGRFDRLPELAREIVAAKPEVIVTAAGPPVNALQQATSTIPIVMLIHDPIGSGFAKSLAHPGGNITGVAFQDWELSARRLDLLRRTVPGMQRVAIFWNDDGYGNRTLGEVQRAADAMGIAWKAFEVRGPAEIPATVAAAKDWGAQGLIELASPVFTKNREVLIEALARHAMPATCEMRLYVNDGCLMTYSANFPAMFRTLADVAVKILEGAKPADTPIEQPREFELVINATTARNLGLTIPQAVLLETTDRVQ